jgi:hypothetical protein
VTGPRFEVPEERRKVIFFAEKTWKLCTSKVKKRMSKPVLTFVKMMGCGPCNNFFGNPDPEKSQWAQLVKDKELAKVVDFNLVEWGFDKTSGQQYKKPAHLNNIQYGPAFVIVDSGKKSYVEYDKNSPKTAAGIKKWALENYKKAQSVSAPAPSTVTSKVVAPRPAPMQASQPGAPLAFVPQERLPPQLRDKRVASVTPTPSPVPQVVNTMVPPPQLQVAAPVVVQAAPVTSPVQVPVAAPRQGLRIVSRGRVYGRRR